MKLICFLVLKISWSCEENYTQCLLTRFQCAEQTANPLYTPITFKLWNTYFNEIKTGMESTLEHLRGPMHKILYLRHILPFVNNCVKSDPI